MTTDRRLLGLDLETTGLLGHEPGDLFGGGHILEIACALLDSDLSIISERHAIVAPSSTPEMNNFVRNMHTANGLLNAIARGEGLSLECADEGLAQWLFDSHVEPRSISLLGNSVHYDLQWINKRMPRLYGFLSHRVFDVSTLIRAAEMWLPGYEHPRAEAHRAQADVYESIATAKAWRVVMGLQGKE